MNKDFDFRQKASNSSSYDAGLSNYPDCQFTFKYSKYDNRCMKSQATHEELQLLDMSRFGLMQDWSYNK